MLITIKSVTGVEYFVEADPSDTVERVKELLYEQTNLFVNIQRLIFGVRQLEDSRTLSDYRIQEGSVLSLVLRLRGMISNFDSEPSSNPTNQWLHMVPFGQPTDAVRDTLLKKVNKDIKYEGQGRGYLLLEESSTLFTSAEREHMIKFMDSVAPAGFQDAKIVFSEEMGRQLLRCCAALVIA